jgi:hypothetical protein
MSNPTIRNLAVAHINTLPRNTAFPVTGVFEMLPSWAIQSGDDRAAPQAANAAFYAPPQVCSFKFWHPGYLVTGGHTVTVTVLGVSAKSNTFAVL